MQYAIECRSCDFSWSRSHMLSIYEREALESRPCPRCGACTLAFHVVERTPKPKLIRMRKRPSERKAE